MRERERESFTWEIGAGLFEIRSLPRDLVSRLSPPHESVPLYPRQIDSLVAIPAGSALKEVGKRKVTYDNSAFFIARGFHFERFSLGIRNLGICIINHPSYTVDTRQYTNHASYYLCCNRCIRYANANAKSSAMRFTFPRERI